MLTEDTVGCATSTSTSVSRTSPVEVHGGHDQRHQRNREVEGVEADLDTHILGQEVGMFRSGE